MIRYLQLRQRVLNVPSGPTLTPVPTLSHTDPSAHTVPTLTPVATLSHTDPNGHTVPTLTPVAG